MRFLRRFLVLIALMFWQGGFTFYASVVVPVGTAVLKNSARRQGFITREVTSWLNVTAAVALGVLAVELLLCRDPSRPRRRLRLALWLFMAGCQGLLLGLHPYLAGLMQTRGLIVLDLEAFQSAHRLYLWTHTAQWAAGVLFVALTLLAWERESREGSGIKEGKEKSSAINRLGVAQSPKQ
jgi:hypothetical protein